MVLVRCGPATASHLVHHRWPIARSVVPRATDGQATGYADGFDRARRRWRSAGAIGRLGLASLRAPIVAQLTRASQSSTWGVVVVLLARTYGASPIRLSRGAGGLGLLGDRGQGGTTGGREPTLLARSRIGCVVRPQQSALCGSSRRPLASAGTHHRTRPATAVVAAVDTGQAHASGRCQAKQLGPEGRLKQRPGAITDRPWWLR